MIQNKQINIEKYAKIYVLCLHNLAIENEKLGNL